ncbi:hypothetical protein HETIRDRAFT_418417 [Heterobasidion irregulare TC 32-1]|uniref:Uncharacterized protein n=1 Tax=Heterobasidion irregulare (strain TC 32-1) TaxID=747525 RepID=W4K3U0_HETIT|nr:uncharacterized protein HETIRDRAFT_418417 [Heterobasidion irregulare TC 32-1]ETW80399.1 hypothetical protein HETIRDRAFT_418417 [Heterobasidion irregulare TC 32-1]
MFSIKSLYAAVMLIMQVVLTALIAVTVYITCIVIQYLVSRVLNGDKDTKVDAVSSSSESLADSTTIAASSSLDTPISATAQDAAPTKRTKAKQPRTTPTPQPRQSHITSGEMLVTYYRRPNLFRASTYTSLYGSMVASMRMNRTPSIESEYSVLYIPSTASTTSSSSAPSTSAPSASSTSSTRPQRPKGPTRRHAFFRLPTSCRITRKSVAAALQRPKTLFRRPAFLRLPTQFRLSRKSKAESAAPRPTPTRGLATCEVPTMQSLELSLIPRPAVIERMSAPVSVPEPRTVQRPTLARRLAFRDTSRAQLIDCLIRLDVRLPRSVLEHSATAQRPKLVRRDAGSLLTKSMMTVAIKRPTTLVRRDAIRCLPLAVTTPSAPHTAIIRRDARPCLPTGLKTTLAQRPTIVRRDACHDLLTALKLTLSQRPVIIRRDACLYLPAAPKSAPAQRPQTLIRRHAHRILPACARTPSP